MKGKDVKHSKFHQSRSNIFLNSQANKIKKAEDLSKKPDFYKANLLFIN